jgi:hypothetical protein
MCEDTNVEVARCWRANGFHCGTDLLLSGIHDTSEYSFAYGIIEDKPVFDGDILYHPEHGKVKIFSTDMIDFKTWLIEFKDVLSWNKLVVDDFFEIKQAQKDGKRVIFQNSAGKWVDIETYSHHNNSDVHNFKYHIDRYKVVDYDYSSMQKSTVWGEEVYIKFTKSGIDGEISIEKTSLDGIVRYKISDPNGVLVFLAPNFNE